MPNEGTNQRNLECFVGSNVTNKYAMAGIKNLGLGVIPFFITNFILSAFEKKTVNL